ncbi:MAG: Txe/YoeB family addiction module toxin [Firmicutes bacterium]|nr:Txe/YoeB family addiction module toxin [Bacillota bacterium]
MVNFKLVYTKKAQDDALKLKNVGLKDNVEKLLNILKVNPFQNLPHYEKLVGDLAGVYSRRINLKHRLVYQVFKDEKIVKVIRMWSHYE